MLTALLTVLEPEADADVAVFSADIEMNKKTFLENKHLEDFEATFQPFFLTWKNMGIRSAQPCSWLISQPKTKAKSMSGGSNTREEQRREGQSRQIASTSGSSLASTVNIEIASRMLGSKVRIYTALKYTLTPPLSSYLPLACLCRSWLISSRLTISRRYIWP